MNEFSTSHSFYFPNGPISNRVLTFGNSSGTPVIFVPGWGTPPEAWRHVLREIALQRKVFYFESREKKHTRFESEAVDFTFSTLSRDLVHFLQAQENKYHLVCASTSASALVKGWSQLRKKPVSLALLTPILRFRSPRFFRLLNAVPGSLIRPLLPAGLKLIRATGYGKDQERIESLIGGLTVKEIITLRKSVKDLRTLGLTDSEIRRVNQPAMVVITGENGLHSQEASAHIASQIKGAVKVHFNSFAEVHSRKCAAKLNAWMEVNE